MAGRLILVGGGAFARELINWVNDLVDLGKSPSVAGYLDDSSGGLAGQPYSVPFLGKINSFTPKQDDRLLMAVGDPLVKKNLYADLKSKGGVFSQLIHPSAVIARTAKLGEGVVVCPHTFVSADATVGELCAINGNSSVGHDVKLGPFCTLSAHVDLTGWVQVDECVFFGSGARVLPKLKIGMRARIGAGSVVMRSVPAAATVYADPARRL